MGGERVNEVSQTQPQRAAENRHRQPMRCRPLPTLLSSPSSSFRLTQVDWDDRGE